MKARRQNCEHYDRSVGEPATSPRPAFENSRLLRSDGHIPHVRPPVGHVELVALVTMTKNGKGGTRLLIDQNALRRNNISRRPEIL